MAMVMAVAPAPDAAPEIEYPMKDFMSHIALSPIRLARALALSLLVCIVTYFSIDAMPNLLAQSPEAVCSNPGFETGDLSCWSEGGDPGLVRVVQTQTVFEGNYAALIGDPFETQDECAGHLPLGSAWVGYTFTVPVQGDSYLSFNYWLLSYDELREGYEDSFDRFDVYIDDLSDPQPRFRVLRDGSHDGMPSGGPRPCDFHVDDSGWLSASWNLSSIPDLDSLDQTYDLRGKTINVVFEVFSQELVGDSAWYNTWVYIDNLQLGPEMAMHKPKEPPGPFFEGFEAGVVPPSGWTLVPTNPNQTWKIDTVQLIPHSGSYYAAVKYDPALLDQDESLLSPAFTADKGSVSLWSFGSLYWCRDTYDNCDLEVWFVNGSWGGGDDVLLGKTDSDWTGEWEWSYSTFDFSPYTSGNPARIALRYVGNDGAKIGVDEIRVTHSPP